MPQVYLGLGSNIEPEHNLPLAAERLQNAVQVLATSTAWASPALECEGPDFLNAVVLVSTTLAPGRLKEEIIRPIEAGLGRVRTENKNAPRPIDIDILIYDGQVFDPDLWRRPYLAVPLAELIPGYTNTNNGRTLHRVAERFKTLTQISPRSEVMRRSQLR